MAMPWELSRIKTVYVEYKFTWACLELAPLLCFVLLLGSDVRNGDERPKIFDRMGCGKNCGNKNRQLQAPLLWLVSSHVF